MMRKGTLTLSTLVVVSVLGASALSTTSARAQEDTPSADVAAARSLGVDGVKLADAGNCEEAVDKLQRAEKIFHAPTTLGRLGECQVQLGKIVEGTENLNRVVREVLPASAPAAFAAAQERAKKVLTDAKPKIAQLKIAVAPSAASVVVKVDGVVIPVANLNSNRPLDPGEHVIDASAPGYKPQSAKVRLAEGGVDSVALTLDVDPNYHPPELVPAAQPGDAPRDDSRPAPSRVPAYVALGVGVAGVGVGVVTGLIASGKRSDLDNACVNKVCPSSSQSDIDSAKTMATVSTVGFIVGGVGLLTGAVLFFTSARESTRPAPAPAAPTAVTVHPYVGLDRAGVVGTF